MQVVRSMAWMAVAVLAWGICAAQTAAWTVKPEWVRVHEEFLASNAMQGRGSATHDEEVTATYVASELIEYGLNYARALKGVVAHTAAGRGTVPTYHQPDDDLAHLDPPFMTAAIQSLVEPLRWLADSDFKPEWNAGGQPKR